MTPAPNAVRGLKDLEERLDGTAHAEIGLR